MNGCACDVMTVRLDKKDKRRDGGMSETAALSGAGASLSGTNLERAGDHNQRVTLQAIRIGGPTTRAYLVEVTGLTPPAIANITKRLLKEKLIIEVGRRQGARGQPAMKLAINPDGSFALGLNIDRDHITLLLLDLAGKVRARVSWDVDFALPEAVADFVGREIGPLLATAGVSMKEILGVGVAMPDDMGRVPLPHWPEGYSAWDGVDIRHLLAPILPLPVFIENDAAAAALGELHFGHGLHHPNFFYVLVSLGLGGGLVIEGNYYRGALGRSGEIGFLPIAGGKSLQEAVSLAALYDHLASDGIEISRPDLLVDSSAKVRASLDRWLDRAAELMEGPLVAINCLINPKAIYIGGRLPAEMVNGLSVRLNRRLADLKGLPAMAPVQRAAMAADAPAVGAAMLPFGIRLLPSATVLMKPPEAGS
jgi:predicted NBD/HSP70 family sugar kinase